MSLGMLVAFGLILVFVVQESGYWGPSILARVRAWWRRRQRRQYAKHQQRIQQEWNPRAEAMRRFGKAKS